MTKTIDVATIGVTFHWVGQDHIIVPLPLDDEFIITDTNLRNDWQTQVDSIRKICKKIKVKPLVPDFNPYSADADSPHLHILFITEASLCAAEFFDRLPGTLLRSVVEPDQRGKPSEGRYNPILTIGYEDISIIFSEQDTTSFIPNGLRFDHRIKFLDSGIWHRYAPQSIPDAGRYLHETLMEMTEYWAMGLYYAVPAVTTLEFQLRMLRHSYIGRFADGDHAAVVTPFKFHSERYLKLKAKREEEFLLKQWKVEGQSLLQALRWRCLVVDDYALQGISTVINKDMLCPVSKADLIRRPLDRLYEQAGVGEKEEHFKLICPPDGDQIIDFSTGELSKQSFDLIFLDYLLGHRSPHSRVELDREYGHEFLFRLLEDNRRPEPAFRRDFLGRNWIFPISSFPFALPDKMAQEGAGHLHSIWHLSGGGDPVSAPHLYAYYLLRFMKQKIAGHFLYPEVLKRFFNEIPVKIEGPESRKQWAGYLDASLQNYENKLDLLKREAFDKTSSPFSESIIRFVEDQTDVREIVMLVRYMAGKVAVRGEILEKDFEKAKNVLIQYNDYQYRNILGNLLAQFNDFAVKESASLFSTLTKVKVFISYSHKDEKGKDILVVHLKSLSRIFNLEIWHDRKLYGGDKWDPKIMDELESSQIVLFLVTTQMLVSDFVDLEFSKAQDMVKSEKAIIIPIILERNPVWEESLYAQYQKLPVSKEAVKQFSPHAAGWYEVLEGLKRLISDYFPNVKKPPPK